MSPGRLAAHPLSQCLPWLGLLLFILFSEERRRYVAAWNDPLLIAGLVILFFGLIAWFLRGRRSTACHGFAWSPLLIQCLPLYLVLCVHAEDLSLAKDFTIALDIVPPAEHAEPERYDAASLGLDVTRFDYSQRSAEGSSITISKPGDATRRIDLVAANSRPEQIRGGQVRVMGRLRIGIDDKLRAAGAEALLYRYAITCCVADAMPMSALLRGLPAQLPAGDDPWVEISGSLRETPGDAPPWIDVESIEGCAAPKEPYLSLGIFR